MAKTAVKAKAPKAAELPANATVEPQIAPVIEIPVVESFLVNDDVSDEVLLAKNEAGVPLKFDYVHFKKRSDEVVSKLSPLNAKAYGISEAEFAQRDREANIALHSIGVDPMRKILDGPKGMGNPLTRDLAKVQARLGKEWYVTSRVTGGEGDFESAQAVGFRPLRRPNSAKGETFEGTDPFDWSGELWGIPDGTADGQGNQVVNMLVVIRAKAWENSNKAMAMASKNRYSQQKEQFLDSMTEIAESQLGGKQKVLAPENAENPKGWNLDETHVEEMYDTYKDGRRIRRP